MHFDKPHFPWNAPVAFVGRYADRVHLPVFDPEYLVRAVLFVQAAAPGSPHRYAGNRYSTNDHARTLAAYYGCVTWVDDAIGRLLAMIDYLGLQNETLVIYTSDHGDMLGYHGLWQKTVFFESSSQLLVRDPGIGRHVRVSDPVGHIDLFPTVCKVLNLPTPNDLDGVSLQPVFNGRALARDAIFSESVVLKQPERAGCMIRTGRFKYNRYLDESDGRRPERGIVAHS